MLPQWYALQSTFICRVQNSVCVFQNIDPTPPLPQRVCPPPAFGAGGGHTRRSIFWKTPDIGLASYSIIPLRYALLQVWRHAQLLQESVVVWRREDGHRISLYKYTFSLYIPLHSTAVAVYHYFLLFEL
jgi:hypothetical protein